MERKEWRKSIGGRWEVGDKKATLHSGVAAVQTAAGERERLSPQ
jgi:hypothetical protein